MNAGLVKLEALHRELLFPAYVHPNKNLWDAPPTVIMFKETRCCCYSYTSICFHNGGKSARVVTMFSVHWKHVTNIYLDGAAERERILFEESVFCSSAISHEKNKNAQGRICKRNILFSFLSTTFSFYHKITHSPLAEMAV